MIPFTYAVVDDDGEVLRKYRWSAKEAKWHKEQGSKVIKLEVVKLDVIKQVEESEYEKSFRLCGEAIY